MKLNKMASVKKDSKFTRSPWASWTHRLQDAHAWASGMHRIHREYKLIPWFHGH